MLFREINLYIKETFGFKWDVGKIMGLILEMNQI